jgi:hypothetical protein
MEKGWPLRVHWSNKVLRTRNGSATFFSLTKIGDLNAQTGDTTAATASYGEAVAIARRLAALDPSNPSLRLDLAQGLCKAAIPRPSGAATIAIGASMIGSKRKRRSQPDVQLLY